MAKIVVFGAGIAGSAFCIPLAERGHEVRLVGTHVDRETVATLASTRAHPRLRVALPPSVQPLPHDRLAEALADDVALVVLAVSTAGVAWAAEQLAAVLARPIPILLLTKGLAAEDDEIRILPAVVQQALAARAITRPCVGGIGGPCLALELAARRDTSAVIAYPEPEILAGLIDLLSAPHYHVRPSTDVVGVEACAALKNLFALGVGAIVGRLELSGAAENGALMHNPAAGVFSQALGELGYLVRALGGRSETTFGLAGAGDLYVTCQGGRNGRMGRLLGHGLTYREAKATQMPDDVVEGAELALAIGPTLLRWCASGRLDGAVLPLARALIDAICHDRALTVPWPDMHRTLVRG